jgi:solute carrier family 25 oxoglutarate transporter 11
MQLQRSTINASSSSTTATTAATTTTGGAGVAAPKASILRTSMDVIRTKGVTGLYAGLTAAYMRQMLYTGTRIGVYNALKDLLSAGAAPGAPVSTANKLASAVICGAVGAAVATPADVCLVRMQSASYAYRNIFDAMLQISKQEGVLTLWSGVAPTMVRASLVAIGQLACYDESREYLVSRGIMSNGPGAYFVASMIAGFAATVLSNPADTIKTRVMNGKGVGSPLACVRDLLVHEGPLALWKGFVPNWARQGPQTMITMVVYQMLLDGIKERRRQASLQ